MEIDIGNLIAAAVPTILGAIGFGVLRQKVNTNEKAIDKVNEDQVRRTESTVIDDFRERLIRIETLLEMLAKKEGK